MANSRKPGSECITKGNKCIKDGTRIRSESPKPGIIGIENSDTKTLPKNKFEKTDEWNWWDSQCKPAPKSVPVKLLIDRLFTVVKMGRKLGFSLAADNLENYLIPKKKHVILPTQTLASNSLVKRHLGPIPSKPQPNEADIRRTMGNKKGLHIDGEHHVVFLGGVLKIIEKGEKKIGQSFNLEYTDSINFYTGANEEFPDLAYGIGGCTIRSEVQVETAQQENMVIMRYLSWKVRLFDVYNFDKGKVAVFSIGDFCIPDSDMVRIKEAGYAKEFSMSTDWWDNKFPGIGLLWYQIPYHINKEIGKTL